MQSNKIKKAYKKPVLNKFSDVGGSGKFDTCGAAVIEYIGLAHFVAAGICHNTMSAEMPADAVSETPFATFYGPS